ICLVCAPAISQQAQNKQQSQRTPPSAQPKPTPNEPAGNGAASDAKTAGKEVPNAADDFIIGPEDVLEIKVWHEPDLTTKAVVRPDGKFGMSLLGDIQASGLTATQLKEQVTTKLDRFYEQPEVSVVVVEIHSHIVTLIGSVGRPGSYSLGG